MQWLDGARNDKGQIHPIQPVAHAGYRLAGILESVQASNV